MTDSTTPQDDAAMSPASAGSVDGDPRKYPASTPQVPLVPAAMYHALVVAHAEIARLRLTDAEREALDKMRVHLYEISRDNAFIDEVCDDAKAACAAITAFLERCGGGR